MARNSLTDSARLSIYLGDARPLAEGFILGVLCLDAVRYAGQSMPLVDAAFTLTVAGSLSGLFTFGATCAFACAAAP